MTCLSGCGSGCSCDRPWFQFSSSALIAAACLAALPPADSGWVGCVMRTNFGWAPFPWAREEPLTRSHEEVLRVADRALYIAKEAGRNRAIGALAPSADGATSDEAGGIPFRIVVTPGPKWT